MVMKRAMLNWDLQPNATTEKLLHNFMNRPKVNYVLQDSMMSFYDKWVKVQK